MPKAGELTYKQKEFVTQYAKTKNGTRSAMKAYDIKNNNKNTAHVIASENLRKPTVINALQKALNKAKYNPVTSINALQENERAGIGKKVSASDSIRASELLLKLSGMVIERSQQMSINYNFESLDDIDLNKLRDKYNKLLTSTKKKESAT